jgi:hypothetical protein
MFVIIHYQSLLRAAIQKSGEGEEANIRTEMNALTSVAR